MYLLLIFLPLIGSFSAGLFGRKLGLFGSSYITVICLGLTFFISLFVFYEVSIIGCCVFIKLAPWINSELLNVDWGFLFDSLTVVMCCVVTFVSSIVHLYSTEYMAYDPHLPRFMSYLSLFTFFMLILVTADNFIQMFVGWEGVGLCSYLLINFWFTRIQANKAAIKAMILNRIGDFGLVIGILIIYVEYKAVDYATVFAIASIFTNSSFNFLSFNFDLISIICFFLFVGAVGKSAQSGLHTWLPDAMEGPTPVSALIHAATMVTAGVFLIARTSPLFEYTPSILSLVTVLGACTAFFAATVGLVQNDLKRVIAYSTCSQLGYMVFACGLSNYSVGVFHLVNHAFFKALLFLGAGSIIHAVADEQDMRKMRGLKPLVPFTYSMMVIGSLALIGFPFLTGFYSKDVILEVAYGKYTSEGHFSYILGSLGAFLTAFYSTRLIYLTFLSKPNGYKLVICSAYDLFYRISRTLFFLVIPSVLIGFYAKYMIVGFESDFWGNALFIMNRVDSEFLIHISELIPVILSSFKTIVYFICYLLGLARPIFCGLFVIANVAVLLFLATSKQFVKAQRLFFWLLTFHILFLPLLNLVTFISFGVCTLLSLGLKLPTLLLNCWDIIFISMSDPTFGNYLFSNRELFSGDSQGSVNPPTRGGRTPFGNLDNRMGRNGRDGSELLGLNPQDNVNRTNPLSIQLPGILLSPNHTPLRNDIQPTQEFGNPQEDLTIEARIIRLRSSITALESILISEIRLYNGRVDVADDAELATRRNEILDIRDRQRATEAQAMSLQRHLDGATLLNLLQTQETRRLNLGDGTRGFGLVQTIPTPNRLLRHRHNPLSNNIVDNPPIPGRDYDDGYHPF